MKFADFKVPHWSGAWLKRCYRWLSLKPLGRYHDCIAPFDTRPGPMDDAGIERVRAANGERTVWGADTVGALLARLDEERAKFSRLHAMYESNQDWTQHLVTKWRAQNAAGKQLATAVRDWPITLTGNNVYLGESRPVCRVKWLKGEIVKCETMPAADEPDPEPRVPRRTRPWPKLDDVIAYAMATYPTQNYNRMFVLRRLFVGNSDWTPEAVPPRDRWPRIIKALNRAHWKFCCSLDRDAQRRANRRRPPEPEDQQLKPRLRKKLQRIYAKLGYERREHNYRDFRKHMRQERAEARCGAKLTPHWDTIHPEYAWGPYHNPDFTKLPDDWLAGLIEVFEAVLADTRTLNDFLAHWDHWIRSPWRLTTERKRKAERRVRKYHEARAHADAKRSFEALEWNREVIPPVLAAAKAEQQRRQQEVACG